MLQNCDAKAVEVKEIHSQGVTILPSMDGVTPICFDNGVISHPPILESASLGRYSKPGYVIAHFVEKFMDTDAGVIPVVRTRLNFRDMVETAGARAGITRNSYSVTPGLYGVGEPDENSEVLVTANFKLTFDILRTSLHKVGRTALKRAERTSLEQISAWILVLDTVGVNVWCAAGKGRFSTQELVRRVKSSGVEKVVKHRRLILPQLSATGVRASDVKRLCGFSVTYGPVRAADITAFLQNSREADADMRRVTFTFGERIILTPVELAIALKPLLITGAALLLISGIGPEFFSFQTVKERWWISLVFLLTGLISGAVVTPALLPLLPFKEFAAKGVITGALFSLCALSISSASSLGISAMVALSLFSTVVSSWLAMNFTGATPFTSPSGVEKEMKRFIPVQAGAVLISLFLWICSAF